MPNNYSMSKKPGDGSKKNPVNRPGRPSQRPSKPTGPSQNRPAGMPLRKPSAKTVTPKKAASMYMKPKPRPGMRSK